ncbi:Verru_Chthon cassette protein A [Verrucomicrobium spinosum]|uniref:Verru_Chthon cassette protein A n=1 Tax=Verrucomicrobium spinosum TaxID=2736 RepID=UPI0012F67812|nr:Verru_Chthon cassette protein A [Verrucomicrobium spinosum]
MHFRFLSRLGRHLPNRRSGMALVLVLSFLVLLSALILAFFGSVTTETKASRHADAGNRSRELVDTVTSVVMAQVRAATTRGPNVAWASQPGMIRTYGVAAGATTSASSAPLEYYKLYSARRMNWVPTDGPFVAQSDVPTTWHEQPALYTDLNLPVLNRYGTRQYPIFYPSSVTGPNPTQGITLTGAPVKGTGPEDNPAPMPVRWLYVLRDGTLTAPSSGTTTTATWETGEITSPTQHNPVVGRIAFWTDDDTNKVNINTAAGDEWASGTGTNPIPGSYWDVPRTNNSFEKERMAKFQPAQREYQRYPGHPATTYLSAVFPSLTRAQIAEMVPRIGEGGSRGGTVIASTGVVTDVDRLYAAVDELVYRPDRSVTALTPADLERTRFFLSAHSRAPEVNLFNRPRVAIWPVHEVNQSDYRTAFDRLIAFCASAGAADYIFKRAIADSPTADIEAIPGNGRLYRYLQTLTDKAVPGYGGTFSSKYPLDRDQILTEILDYIRSTNLFDDTLEPQDQNQPAGWTFPTKGKQFTKSRATISTGAVGHGQVVPLYVTATDTMGFGRYETLTEAGLHFICTADPAVPASNAVVDADGLKKNKTLGTAKLQEGEIRVEALFLLELFSVMQGWTSLNEDTQIRVTGLEQLQLKGDGSGDAMQDLGFPADATIWVTKRRRDIAHERAFGGQGGFRVTLVDRGLPARGDMPKDASATNIQNTYPFVSKPITIKPGTARTMTLQMKGSQPIQVQFYHGGVPAPIPAYPSAYVPDAAKLVQTIELKFPSRSFPAPGLVTSGHNEMNGANLEYVTTQENFWSFSKDGAQAGKTGRIGSIARPPNRGNIQTSGGLFRDVDTVRTLVPVHGDYRLVAGMRTVPDTVFVPHQHYDAAQAMAHSFTTGYQSHGNFYGSTRTGKLVPGASYQGTASPDVPFKDPPWGSDSGDWDTGLAFTPDGAYINKPDEGHNSRGTDGQAVPYFTNDWLIETSGPTFFSPNRQVMSPVMFGSLPSQLKSGVPWRTLLFRPDPSPLAPPPGASHIGAQSPRDHLLLDLFWMPVVEPYAISEPFSTAGKINLNFQIVPFTYVERTTALHALFRSERVTAIPVADAGNYKGGNSKNYRYEIDAQKTLDQFRTRFAAEDLFRSPGDICELHLIPRGVPGFGSLTAAGMTAFWQGHSPGLTHLVFTKHVEIS